MILYLDCVKIISNKCEKPKFRVHAGRLWTKAKIKIDGKEIECTYDSKYGRFIFFQYNKNWHSMSMYSEYCDKVQYSFNPLPDVLQFSTTKKIA